MRRYVILLALLVPAGAHAQASLEVRGGAAFPTADLGPTALNTGGGFEVTAGYRFMPHLGVYGGWDWMRTSTDGPLLGSDYDVEDTGYAFGLVFRHPLLNALGGWARAGGIYNHVELENDDGDTVANSGHELGWEAGGGVQIPIGRSFALTPGVRYRSFSGSLDVENSSFDFDRSYLAVEVGLQWSFGGPAFAAFRNR